MNIAIEKYDARYETAWDDFVLNKSVNGTFLQTRKFLSYHPEGRFQDASILVMNGNNILAVIPACDTEDDGKRTLFSHKGSTFGGVILGKQAYNITHVQAILAELDAYLKASCYEKVILKSTSALFSDRDMSLLDYELFKYGYDQYNELSFFVDLKNLPEDPIMAMSTSRRRDTRYAMKNDFRWERLTEDEQIAEFYRILEINLQKFDAKPVHTLDELLAFKHEILPEIVDFYGIYLDEKMAAGTMLFRFGSRVLHTQYLAALPEYQKQFPMNFLDYNLILLARDQGYDSFSFGISTEERGKVLNTGLALFKEGFGSEYSVNRTFVKEL